MSNTPQNTNYAVRSVGSKHGNVFRRRNREERIAEVHGTIVNNDPEDPERLKSTSMRSDKKHRVVVQFPLTNLMLCCPRAALQASVQAMDKSNSRSSDSPRSVHPERSTSAKDEPVDEKNPGSEPLNEGWRRGLSPSQLSIEWTSRIQKLFLEGTGEEYFIGTIQTLPVPDWNGNFMLFDSENEHQESMRGLLWTTPFKDDTVRIVSFVLDEGARGKGWGTLVWNMMADQLLPAGYNFVQLEVRASNEGAISFYRKRGLEIVQELHGYYRQGLGYMMRGQLRHHHPNNDTP